MDSKRQQSNAHGGLRQRHSSAPSQAFGCQRTKRRIRGKDRKGEANTEARTTVMILSSMKDSRQQMLKHHG